MADYQIFSDGACDLGDALANEYDISIIPFYVSLDQETYQKELEELSLETYYDFLKNSKKYPKTSLPSVQDYIDAFRPALEAGKDLICLTITNTLSGSIQSATTAKDILTEEFPNATIHVINSLHCTGSQALILMEASRMKKAGKTIEETLAYIEKAKVDARIHFMVGDLSYLEIGGRIGRLATLSGSILKIKPIIILRNGEISIGGAVRSRKKGLLRILEVTKEYFQTTGQKAEDFIATIGVNTIPEEFTECKEMLLSALPGLNFLGGFHVGAAVSTHTGPGTIGVCFAKKYQAYDL